MSNNSIVSVKVPPNLLEQVRQSKQEIDWPEEIRTFIRDRLRRWRAERLLGEVHNRHARLPPRPRGFAADLVREDRDRH